jgi:hypothetical protein
LVWCGFDRDNHLLVYDELYLQNTPLAYWTTDRQGLSKLRPAKAGEKPSILDLVAEKNRVWGVTPTYWVIDPASRIRDMQSAAESVHSALMRAGVSVLAGENDRLAGVLQMQGRLESNAMLVSKGCSSLLREFDRWLVADDEETLENRPRGSVKGASFKTIGPDHLCDGLRYVCMNRVWGSMYAEEPAAPWQYTPGEAVPARYLQPAVSAPPMGSMS